MSEDAAKVESAVLDVAKAALARHEQRLADLRKRIALVADSIDRAADARSAAIITGGGSGSQASVVYELRAFSKELREAVGQ